ncbi:MAG: hypothetical protein O2973_05490 [Gemmatimonadetes bacterium]|nr:hypothetical protein [Gemmatimonadota bacterium]
MPSRTVDVNGTAWEVLPSGFVTQSAADEFGVLFVRGSGADRELRVSRYCPSGARAREASLAACSDAALVELFERSQPSAMSPEGGYAP